MKHLNPLNPQRILDLAMPQLIANRFASASVGPMVHTLASYRVDDDASRIQLKLVAHTPDLAPTRALESEDLDEEGHARNFALSHNLRTLELLVAAAREQGHVLRYGTGVPFNFTCLEWENYLTRYIDGANNEIFRRRHGNATDVIAGMDASVQLRVVYGPRCSNCAPKMTPDPDCHCFPGLLKEHFPIGASSGVFSSFRTPLWNLEPESRQLLILRAGVDSSDRPLAWLLPRNPRFELDPQLPDLPPAFVVDEALLVAQPNCVHLIEIVAEPGSPLSA